jgi:hypothetical protein
MELFRNLDEIPLEYRDFFRRLKSGKLTTTNKSSKLSKSGEMIAPNDKTNIFSNDNADKSERTQISKDKQKMLVDFVSSCILDFLNSKSNEFLKSCPIKDLTGEDMDYFQQVSDEYKKTYGIGGNQPTLDELLKKNRTVTDEKEKKSYFETMKKSEMTKILGARVTQLQSCSINTNKSEEDKRYYGMEAEREAQSMRKLDGANEVAFRQILGEISDDIQFSKYVFDADYSPTEIEKLLVDFEKEENSQKRKYLATFLPLELFNITEINGSVNVTFKKEALKAFLIKQGGDHKNIQQMMLGYGVYLRPEIFYKYRQIALSMGFQFDAVNQCGYLVDWSVFYNLLVIYLFSQSNERVFPIRFMVPEAGKITDANGSTFHIRYPGTVDLDLLFESTEFIGVHMLKYQYPVISDRVKGFQSRLWFVFTFKIVTSTLHEKKLSNLGFSYHSGKRIYYLNIDLFLNFLEFGEIFKKQSVTHREFKRIYKWYGLTPYVMNDDFDNIFFTKLEKSDDKLTRVCDALKMKEVYIKEHEPDGKQMKYSVELVPAQKSSHGGGDENSKIKLSFTKQLKMIDEPIWGLFYKKCLDIFLKYHKEAHKFLVNSDYINPYFFANEGNIFTKSIQHKFNKYIPFTPQFYRGLELVKIYLSKNILSNPDLVFTEIGSMPIFSEVIKYYNYKIKELNFYRQYHNYRLNDNDDVNNINIFQELYNKIKSVYDFNFYNIGSSIYTLIENDNSIKKSDIITYSIYNILFDIKKYRKITKIDNYINIINIFVGLLVGLKYLNLGGILILEFNAIVNKATADIYLIAKKYFKKTDLYYPEVSNMSKRSGCYCIFSGYQGCPKEDYDKLYNILQDLKKIYPTYPNDLNINDNKIIEMYQFKHIHNNNQKSQKTKNNKTQKTIQHHNKYIYGFLDLPEKSPEYEEIIDYNNNRYIKQLEFLKKLNLIMDMPDQELSKISIPTQEQITYSIMYCKKWGIEYFPYYYDSKVMNDKMGQQILTEIYGNVEPISYKFKTSLPRLTQKNSYKLRKTKKPSLKKMKSSKKISEFHSLNLNFMQEINNINNLMVQTGYMIDSRRDFDIKDPKHQLYNYFMANVLFRFYKSSGQEIDNNLAFMVRDKIQRNVSQAWLKLYEILYEIDIIPKQQATYKTFHLCEAPGSFIDCLDYFIKKETNVKQFIWNAQSHKPTKGKKYFGDDYGIIKSYPNRWHWGKDGNGDITSCNNIFSYKELCKDIDLITSDCGLPMNEPGYHRVLFSSMVAITYLLPKDGDMIFKILLPIDIPIIWNIIYLWFNNFKEFQFFKPVQNHQSREFYIIGKKYSGKLENSKIMTQLLGLVKDSRDTFMTTDLFEGNYSELFTSQMIDISQKLCDNWTFTIQKQIYYSDNMDSLDKSFKTKAKAFINQKNLDFIEKYNLIKIEK